MWSADPGSNWGCDVGNVAYWPLYDRRVEPSPGIEPGAPALPRRTPADGCCNGMELRPGLEPGCDGYKPPSVPLADCEALVLTAGLEPALYGLSDRSLCRIGVRQHW